jgi:MoaA/NifB/PqqE/SkfB family radical SAM enzyme
MEPEDISYLDALKVMDRFHELGVRLLIFEGGEPFLWRDGDYSFEDLARYARNKFFRVGVTTNGMFPLETSADIVWVSFDGIKEDHERNRGPGFDVIVKNIKNSNHKSIFANVTISRLNFIRIEEFFRYLKELVRGITIQFYYPFPNTEDLSLDSEQRIAVLDKLIALKRDGIPILDSFSALEKLKRNTWKCHDWLISNAEPDGKINIGCYLKDRAPIACEKCGFAAHTEISLAHDWNSGAILAGKKIFAFRSIYFG